jgi:hypothetical protein
MGENANHREPDWMSTLQHALDTPGSIGNTYTRFPHFSYLNRLALQLQGVEGPYATFQVWKDLGRYVLKGAKAKEILRPITVTKKNEDGQVEDTFTKFKWVRCVFDYKDTGGDELPQLESPGWEANTALSRLDIRRVPFTEMNGNIAGYSIGREIAVNPMAPYPLKTTMHEAAHVISGHTAREHAAKYATHRGEWEFVAEASAYLTLKELDVLDENAASVSRAYCQHWLQDEGPSEAAIRQVFRNTDQLLKAGRLAVEGGEKS